MLFLVLVLLRLFSCSVAQSCMGTCMWAHPGVPCLRDDSEEYFDELTAPNLQPHYLTSLPPCGHH